jgi:hypothetical protein
MAHQLGLVSCSSQEHIVHGQRSSGFGDVFEGFVFVGVDVKRESHNARGMEMPRRILANHDYVFHHTYPFDDAVFAGTSVPQYLEKLGFSVTKEVDAGQGLIAVGPVHMWSVNFVRGNCSGSIGNRVCLDLTKRRLFRNSRWEQSDNILTLHGGCSVES